MKYILVIISILLTGCASQYAYLDETMYQCGFDQTSFIKFSTCMKDTVNTPEHKLNGRAAGEITVALDNLERSVKEYNKSDDYAFKGFNSFADSKIANNGGVKSNNKAVAGVVVLGLMGAAALYCHNTSCLQGGAGLGSAYTNPNDPYQGCCSYHGGVSYINNTTTPQCYGNRIICLDGKFSPSCKCPY